MSSLWLNFGLCDGPLSLEQGKRLFPLLGSGASAGAVAGAWIAGQLIKPLGPYKIMLIALAALCICAALTRLGGLHHHEAWRRTREGERPGDPEQ